MSRDREALANRLLGDPALAPYWRDVTLETGDVLFRQGDPGDAFYTVISGALRVLRCDDGQGIVLARLGPGAHVGEVALIDGGVRTALVEAVEPSALRVLSRVDFEEALNDCPELTSVVLSVLGLRMRRMHAYLDSVTAWARLVSRGDYADARSAMMDSAARSEDANLAGFARNFTDMVTRVQEREAALRRELHQMRIEIDDRQRERQVAEITEDEFFRSLQSRARDMRRRIRDADGARAGHGSERSILE